jgi:diguanylate cyclase (GGDEF)-like protein
VEIDNFTILASTGAVVFVLGALFVFMWRQDTKAGWLIWLASPYFLGALAVVFLAPRGHISNLITMGLGTSAMLLALGAFWAGARVFEGRRPILWLPVAVAVGWLALFALPGFDQGALLAIRVALASSVAAAFMFLGAWEFWRGRAEVLPSRLPVIIFYITAGCFFAFRIVAVGWLPFPLGGQVAHPLATAAFNLVVFTHALFIGMLTISLTKERREATQRALAETDPLTGLLNRRAFAADAEKILRRQKQAHAPMALLILDLDHFKSINDRWGHDAGDRVLVEFAAVLGRCLRQDDMRYRIGGEEFCCLLPGLTMREAQGIADRICETFQASSVDVLGGSVRGTVSIGISSTDLCGFVLEDLLSEADAAAYEAKATGRNRAVLAIASPKVPSLTLVGSVADVRGRWQA